MFSLDNIQIKGKPCFFARFVYGLSRMRMPRKPFIVIMKNHSLPTGVISQNFNAFLEVEVLFSQPTALFSPYVDDVSSLLSTNLREKTLQQLS